jgi:hypothetical protein
VHEAAAREIVDFHVCIERWFAARDPADPALFQRIELALAESFSMITPDGRSLRRETVVAGLRAALGTRDTGFRIWIEQIRPVLIAGDHAVMTYDECQHTGGRDTRRHATAVFIPDHSSLTGVAWLHVHETWTQ